MHLFVLFLFEKISSTGENKRLIIGQWQGSYNKYMSFARFELGTFDIGEEKQKRVTSGNFLDHLAFGASHPS